MLSASKGGWQRVPAGLRVHYGQPEPPPSGTCEAAPATPFPRFCGLRPQACDGNLTGLGATIHQADWPQRHSPCHGPLCSTGSRVSGPVSCGKLRSENMHGGSLFLQRAKSTCRGKGHSIMWGWWRSTQAELSGKHHGRLSWVSPG